MHQGYPSKLYVGHEELQWSHSWLKDEDYKEYREKYDNPLWKRLREQIDANAVGHGGMDCNGLQNDTLFKPRLTFRY